VTALSATAKAAIRAAGFTVAEWSRMHGGSGGKWTGDQCGCPDDRCANGFHHMGTDDCGCLPTLLDQAVAWREATRWPNSVELAAPFGLFNWVTVSTPGVLATVSATAGGIPAGKPAESVVRIEAREGWTASVGEDEHGRMVVRLTAAAGPDEADTTAGEENGNA
jgi:hypothetical protein